MAAEFCNVWKHKKGTAFRQVARKHYTESLHDWGYRQTMTLAPQRASVGHFIARRGLGVNRRPAGFSAEKKVSGMFAGWRRVRNHHGRVSTVPTQRAPSRGHL